MILPGGTAAEQLEQAVLAEQAGWDGVFVWEAAYGVDAWGLLSAMAVATSRVRLGTMLTPLPWRRPWKVASQVATLDQLSGGRAILTVGVGALTTDLPLTGEETDLRVRASMMDEGIDLIRALWAGESHYSGQHYQYAVERNDLAITGRPVQERIPIWVVGVWPRPKSMRRVLKCDGVVPGGEMTPASVREMRAWLLSHGAAATVDVIAEGETPGADVAAWEEAGCTWWMETRWEMPHHSAERMAQIRERIAAGPPR
ncbi:LLM class flavin-dependent oxidoreductase [Paractinoplanes atraurantiacus]|uniref:Luciferase-like monooxygenase n=1 Tax=Paractinoplanes atraurantiacus TaxID=1036182 RepID=A0A285J969_9ACTN|nr:LLM class flavin-dependent oxidoreductase [Actinoplanes atraurantiacus]SNY56860.1 Luciferase-like monooxygenase [Actinoplanes atraurantiacus]